MTKPVIFGCSTTSLTDEEVSFFKEQQPFGFILFARNIENRDQVKALTEQLRACVNHDSAAILIDQEGGRVARLKAPEWQDHPACGSLCTEQEAYGQGYEIGKMLAELGINVDCAPMLDVRQAGAHDIVGDRAFSEDPELVAKMGLAMANGLIDAEVQPIIKHIPGHGRAMCDSHLDLPRVSASLDELEVDFLPFKKLAHLPFAMTAHIIYEAIDAENCATQSKNVIDVIRGEIGFKGLIMTDDLSMKALSGSFAERTKRSLEAGCDLILHCNGNMSEMREIADAL